MAYTNKTPNYNLPQYVDTDKPKYLTDFNTAMSNIDGAIKSVADSIPDVPTDLETALTNLEGDVSALQADNTTNKNNISSIKTKNTTQDTNITKNHNILLSFFEGFKNVDNWSPTA